MIESSLDSWPVQALQATLDIPGATRDPLHVPPLWHWLYFLSAVPRSSIAVDGHAASQGGADPKVHRRMFAAARTEFLRPLHIGRRAVMDERLLAVRDTRGKSGPMQIMTFEYRYLQDDVLCIREERDIVYLAAAPAAQAPAAAATAAVTGEDAVQLGAAQAAAGRPAADPWTLTLSPDAVLLMRFSALTFNAHRIHYDQHYARAQEGYPERIVHGPLTAIVLAQVLAVNGIDDLRRFEFRARRPLYVDQPIRCVGRPAADRIELTAAGPSGEPSMRATAWPAGG